MKIIVLLACLTVFIFADFSASQADSFGVYEFTSVPSTSGASITVDGAQESFPLTVDGNGNLVLISDTSDTAAFYFWQDVSGLVFTSGNIYARFVWFYTGVADGVALVFQSISNSVVGYDGSDLGAQGIPNAFVVGLSFFDSQIRVYSTDSNGNAYNQVSETFEFNPNTPYAVELIKTGNTQYSIFLNTVSVLTFDYSQTPQNYLSNSGDTIYVGVTAGAGEYPSSVYLSSLYYTSSETYLASTSQNGFTSVPPTAQAISTPNGETLYPPVTVNDNDDLTLISGSDYTTASYWWPGLLSTSYLIRFTFNFNFDGTADGIAFVLRPATSSAFGNNGNSLGALGIANAFVVGFSIYTGQLRIYSTDENGNSFSEIVLGDTTPFSLPEVGTQQIQIEALDDGSYQLTATWDGDVSSFNFDDPQNFISSSGVTAPAGTPVYVGVTAGSGEYSAVINVHSFSYTTAF